MSSAPDPWVVQQPVGPPEGLTRRASRALLRRVDAMFSAHGPAFRQLAISWSANVAGDALVAIALAGTLFFDVPSSDARGKVALYLLITLAPFAVIGPLLGRMFARYPGAYLAGLVVSGVLRAGTAVVMAFGLDTLWLYPLAFGMLVASRVYGISKNSLLPVALPQPVALVAANARLTRIGILAGAVVVGPGIGALRLAGPWLPLTLSVVFYLVSSVTGLRVPTPGSVNRDRDLPPARVRYSPGLGALPRALALSRLATAVVRLLNGFLLLLLAFAFKESDAGVLDFGALLGAAYLGFGLSSVLAPWLERRLREEPMVVSALAVEAAAAFIAAQGFGLGAAAALAAAAGLAWGTAKFGFDGLPQQTVDPAWRGIAFTRAETLFQLAWVVGATLPVAISIPTGLGLVLAGCAALVAQVVLVSGLLVSVREPGAPQRSRGAV
ncbi:MAG: hypothetical protein ACE5KX_00555 [Acidimicrobiia bacterium]